MRNIIFHNFRCLSVRHCLLNILRPCKCNINRPSYLTRLADGTGSSSSDGIALPQSLSKLDSFSGCKRNINPGQYLVCVYGENLITKSTFNNVAVPAKNDAREVKCLSVLAATSYSSHILTVYIVYCDILEKVLELEEVDEALVESKMAMETLKAEYIQVHLRSVHFSRFLRDVTDCIS